MSVERTEMSSHEPGEVYELIAQRYVDHRSRILGRPEEFMFRSASAHAGGMTVDHIDWEATMEISADPFDTILIVSVLNGRFDVTSGRDNRRAEQGEALMYLPGVPPEVIMDRMTYRVAQFPLAAAERVADRLGVKAGDFRFERMTPVSPAMNRRWMATMTYLTRLFSGPEPAVTHPLMLSAAIDAAAAAAVAVFPNTTMTMDYIAGPGRTGPAALRRAIAYIEAHAAEPIRPEQIAAAAGLSVRGLQAAFRRHHDTTPTAFLRRIRMERANQELLAAGPDDTFADIARRWGFAATRGFAAEYRRTFGRTPRPQRRD
ncbi:AraC family transcriptional regulator [Actinoplanes sp. OR16]|uniref:helix-turn-helix domain-containing protein n=1 Tax=Actinoplanes sp. OR16 TaxID=946334 RepID=UPI000FD895BD|nr:AraC family transcriptional regulator [Actinoplanes sp. OR16]